MLESSKSVEMSNQIPVDSPVIKHPRTEMSRGEEKRVKGTALTARQREVLEIIRRHVRVRGVPPSRSELARELGVKQQSTVDQQLNSLAKKQWIKLIPGVERGIKLLREGAPIFEAGEVPEVSAGTPTLAEERPIPRLHDYESVLAQFEGTPDYYLRVQGDSMDKAGFRTGDVVAVEREREPHEGDVVVARLGTEITLKRYCRKAPDRIELQPESTNREHTAITIDRHTDDWQIVGVVVGAIVGTRGQQDCSAS